MTLRDLARKHQISERQIYAHSKEGKWQQKRVAYRRRTSDKAIARASGRASVKMAREILEPMMITARRVTKELEEELRDPRFMHRHQGMRSSKDGWSESAEFDFQRLDGRNIKEISIAFQNFAEALYKFYEIDSRREKVADAQAADRKKLEERKIKLAEDAAQREQDDANAEIVVRMEGFPEEYTP